MRKIRKADPDFICVMVVLGICLSTLVSIASALTDAERMQLLEDRFLRGEVPSNVYLELREKYKQRLSTEQKEAKQVIEPGVFSYGYWIECEEAKSTKNTNFPLDTDVPKWQRYYSGGKGLGIYSKTLPEEGKFFACYEFELPEKDQYNLWFRGSPLNITRLRSTFSFSIDKGNFVNAAGLPAINSDKLTWTKLGSFSLGKGKHTLKIESREKDACQRYGYHKLLDVFTFI